MIHLAKSSSHRGRILAHFGLVFSLTCQILSLIFGKMAAVGIREFTPAGIARAWPFWLSLMCLGLQALVWPLVLRRLPLFRSYLVMSGVYLAIPGVSWLVFHERVSSGNLVGALIIMVGIVTLLTGSQGETVD